MPPRGFKRAEQQACVRNALRTVRRGCLTHQVHMQSAVDGAHEWNLVPSRRAHHLMPSALAAAT